MDSALVSCRTSFVVLYSMLICCCNAAPCITGFAGSRTSPGFSVSVSYLLLVLFVYSFFGRRALNCSLPVEKAENKHCEAKEAAAIAERWGDVSGMVDELMVWRSVLLSMMSLDPEKMRRKMLVALPSLKFLRETYSAVLDVLRSNGKLQHLSHLAVSDALEFVKVYKRKTESRRMEIM